MTQRDKKRFLFDRMSDVNKAGATHKILARAMFDEIMLNIENHLRQQKMTADFRSNDVCTAVWEKHAHEILPEVREAYCTAFVDTVLAQLSEKEVDCIYDLAVGKKFDNGPAMRKLGNDVRSRFSQNLQHIVRLARDRCAKAFRDWIPALTNNVTDVWLSTTNKSSGPVEPS